MRRSFVLALLFAMFLTGCAKISDVENRPLADYRFEAETPYYSIVFTQTETVVIDRAGELSSPVIASVDGYDVVFEGQKITSPSLFGTNSVFNLGQLLKKILTEEIQSEKSTTAEAVVLSGTYKGCGYSLTVDKKTSVPLQLEYNGFEAVFKGSK